PPPFCLVAPGVAARGGPLLITPCVAARGGPLFFVLLANHRRRLFLGDAFVALGDLTGWTGELANSRRLAPEVVGQRLGDRGRISGPALLDEIALDRRPGAFAEHAVDRAAEATESRQFLLSRAHPF